MDVRALDILKTWAQQVVDDSGVDATATIGGNFVEITMENGYPVSTLITFEPDDDMWQVVTYEHNGAFIQPHSIEIFDLGDPDNLYKVEMMLVEYLASKVWVVNGKS